jgi:hypothetical protein
MKHKEEQEKELSKAYNILSAAGFQLQIEEGFMSVWYKGCSIEIDIEDGIVVIPEEDLDEFYEKQFQV